MKYTKLNKNEHGMAAILITLVLMLTISLIVVAFARISRREQRQSLDRQLSTQAFYAAETGVNDAKTAIKNGYTGTKTTCDTDTALNMAAGLPSGPSDTPNVLDSSSGIAYTCLLVDPAPTSLVYGNLNPDAATIIPISTSAAIQSLNFSWQAADGGSSSKSSGCPSSTANFPDSTSWPVSNCDAGVLRVDITPTGGTLNRVGLMSGTLTVFLYPQRNGITSTIPYVSNTGDSAGAVVSAKCTKTGPNICNVSVSGLGGTNYYVRILSIYKSNTLTITAQGASSTLQLNGAQTAIDSTGKANDILRRISVRLNLASSGKGIPIGAVQSGNSICKRFAVGPGFAVDESGSPNCSL
jgi:hypothetical protein